MFWLPWFGLTGGARTAPPIQFTAVLLTVPLKFAGNQIYLQIWAALNATRTEGVPRNDRSDFENAPQLTPWK